MSRIIRKTALACLATLFLVSCYQATSSSGEEFSSTSEQRTSTESRDSSDSSVSSESCSSSVPGAIYEGFTLSRIQIITFYDSSNLPRKAILFLLPD